MAFIIAGIVLVITIGLWLMMMWGASMSDSPSASRGVAQDSWTVLVVGVILAVAIFSSHWWHFTW